MTVRVAILRSLVRLHSDTDTVVRVVRQAQEDSEPAVRDEAITSAGRAFITGTGELAAAILPLVSRGGCDRLPTVDAGSDPASSDHLLDNIKYVLMTQSLSNDMDQCITTMVRSYVSSPARSLGLLGTLSKAKDKSAAVRVALAILDGCRSDPGAQAACVSAARVLQTSIAEFSTSDPHFVENSHRLDSALDDLEANVAGRRIPRALRPYTGWPIALVLILGLAGVITALFYRISTRETLARERMNYVRELRENKKKYESQLDELGHSAQLEAARSALKHFTPPPPALRRENIAVAGAFRQGAGVYGDFFNWYTANDGDTWLYLVDVEGRGFLAAISSTLIRHVLDSTMEQGANTDPRDVLSRVDRQFERFGTTRDLAATMNLFRLSTSKGTLQLANAGMPAPLIFRYGQPQPDPIQAAGVYVGSGYSHYKIEPALATESIHIGDLIVAYSDGVIEARDEAGNPWGVGGLSSQVMRYLDADVDEIAKKIIDGVTNHSGAGIAQDDQCAVVVRIGSNTDRRRVDSAPTISVVRSGSGADEQIEFTIVNSIDAMKEIGRTLRPDTRDWAGRVSWDGDYGRLWMGIFEAILNSFRHATRKGDRIRVTFRRVSSDAVVDLDQPSEWRDWDKSLGPDRRALVERVAKLTPEMEQWGTLLMLWYSDSLEVLRQGRLIRMKFSQKWRKGEQ